MLFPLELPSGPNPPLILDNQNAHAGDVVSRKRSIPDSKSVGRSSIVPYRRGEDFRTRHRRRLATSLERETEVRRWCVKHGMTLRITNDGHHWQITDGVFLAEWWPSSAKLVIGKCWHAGIHCHDYTQVLKVIQDSCEKLRRS